MLRHWNYLKYVLRHKWFVLVAGVKIGVPLWRLLVHDMSKFLPSEWNAYARMYYNQDGSRRKIPLEHTEFDLAWLKHQHRNKHHWEYWVLHNRKDGALPLEMPQRYAREMVADWMGAGRTIRGKWEYANFYEANKHRMLLHDGTRDFVETIVFSPFYN